MKVFSGTTGIPGFFDLQRHATLVTDPPADPAPTDPPAGDPPGGDPPNDPPADPAPTDPPAGDPNNDPNDPNKDPNKPVVPEKYEFKLPEGMTLDTDASGKFEVLAKEIGLTQEQAQKLVDIQFDLTKKQADAFQAGVQEMIDGWKTETITMLGANKDKELSFAAKALNQFGTPEFRQLIDDTGLGNHKDFVSFMIKAGKAISEDNFLEGKRGVKVEANLQQVYGKSNMNP